MIVIVLLVTEIVGGRRRHGTHTHTHTQQLCEVMAVLITVTVVTMSQYKPVSKMFCTVNTYNFHMSMISE